MLKRCLTAFDFIAETINKINKKEEKKMDLKLENENQKLKVRANGVIINDGKVLMCSINNNGFWCCPGGHIHLGEDSKTAVIREINEEVEIKFDDARLITFMESFFAGKNDKRFHELSFYYLMQGRVPEEKVKDYSYDENDEGKMVHLEFKWIPLSDIDKFDVRPKDFMQVLKSGDFDRLHHIIAKEI